MPRTKVHGSGTEPHSRKPAAPAAVKVSAPSPAVKLRVAENLGGGSFAAPLIYDIGSSAWRVTVGDYNGDDALDIAVSTLHEVSIFLQEV